MYQEPSYWWDACGQLVFVSLFGVSSWILFRYARRTQKEADQLSYFPPVNQATMPDEEVLLRGSNASAQEQSQVLLRGIQNREEADGQELLRASRQQDRR